MDAHIKTFKDEARELLLELETSLLELDERPDNHEVMDRVFRAMHTIKGSGAMFGFEILADFTHQVETAFDLVREGRIPVNPELISLPNEYEESVRPSIITMRKHRRAERRRERPTL